MLSRDEAKDLLRDLFEEEALVIGGLVAIHDVEDDVVWRLMKGIDAIRAKTFRRLDETDPPDEPATTARPHLEPHPAIEEFLLKLRRAA